MKDELKKARNKALALSDVGIVPNDGSAQVAIVPLSDVELSAKVDQEIDRLFKSVTGPLRAILKPAGVAIHDVHIQWGHRRSQAAEVYGHLRQMQITLEVRSGRLRSEV